MKVLITGNKGFVGRNFEKYLKEDFLDIEIVGVDIKDGLDCRDFFKNSKEVFDIVFHFAAIVGGRENIENEPLSIGTDLSIDSEMFNWALRTNQKKVCYFSSSAVYPNKIQVDGYKVKESDFDLANYSEPDSVYGWVKVMGEILAKKAQEKGLNVYIFRPFSGYGEDQDLVYPFPAFVNRAKNKDNPFEIWGNGSQVRDFIYIKDIYKAVMSIMEANYQEPVNLGNSLPTTFNELKDIVCDHFDYNPKIKYLFDKPVGAKFRCCDNSKMLEFYKPKYTIKNILSL